MEGGREGGKGERGMEGATDGGTEGEREEGGREGGGGKGREGEGGGRCRSGRPYALKVKISSPHGHSL